MRLGAVRLGQTAISDFSAVKIREARTRPDPTQILRVPRQTITNSVYAIFILLDPALLEHPWTSSSNRCFRSHYIYGRPFLAVDSICLRKALVVQWLVWDVANVLIGVRFPADANRSRVSFFLFFVTCAGAATSLAPVLQGTK